MSTGHPDFRALQRQTGRSGPPQHTAMAAWNASPSNAVVLRPYRARRHRGSDTGGTPAGDRRARRLEHAQGPVGAVLRRAARNARQPTALWIHALQRPHGSLYDDDIRYRSAQPRRTMTTPGSFATGRTTETEEACRRS